MKTSIYGGVALVLVSLGQGVSRAQEKTSIDAEQTGTRLDVTINRSGLIFDGEMSLRMDVDYVYRASTLLDEPVINCGVRIRNITGTLTVQHEGASHSVTIGPENSDRINIYHVDLLARYAAPGFGYHLACNTGVPAREGTEPFNVASSPSWSATFCDWYRGPSDLPERLGAEWCAEGNGRYVGEAVARGIYADDWAHRSAEIEVGSLSINPNDLIVAEIARLRQEAEARAAAADRVKAMLDRVAGVTPDASETKPGAKDPLAAMAERIAAARAAKAATGAEETDARARAEADRIAREKEATAEAAELAAAQAAKAAAEAARKAEAERKTVVYPSLRRVEFAYDDPRPQQCPEKGDVFYMNVEGSCISGPFNYGNEFSEGFAVVESEGFAVNTHGQDQGLKWVWFIDAKGELRFGPYSNASDFNDGFATVYNDGVPSFIDREGNTQFGDFARWTGWFTLGVAPVQREEKGKMWFMDTEGRNANLGEYDFAGSFSKTSKLAVVQKDGKFGAINRDGETVIPFNYSNIEKLADYNKAHHFLSGSIDVKDSTGLAYYMATTHYKDVRCRGDIIYVLMSKDGAVVAGPDEIHQEPRADYCREHRLLFRD